MATKSILKNVNIKTRQQVRQLTYALENAENKRGKEVILSRTVAELKADQVMHFFNKA